MNQDFSLIPKKKILEAFLRTILEFKKLSPCPRNKIAAAIYNPEIHTAHSFSFNGPPRGPLILCGGDACLRDSHRIPSGTATEIGCIHAEANSIASAASSGTSTKDQWMLITGEPCLNCAKLIYQAGITTIIVIEGGYNKASAGITFLEENKVNIYSVQME